MVLLWYYNVLNCFKLYLKLHSSVRERVSLAFLVIVFTLDNSQVVKK
jgi:hypothetical protein